MKRTGLAIGLLALVVLIGAWGRTGHSTIGIIAENHLTTKAKAAVATLLNGQTLSDVASWADDNRDRTTAPWHFINVEPGLSYEEFSKEVAAKEDVYTVLQAQEVILADNNASVEKRATALKYIVHFVGDIHQPMHVSRAEDKGGNTIQVRYDGDGTNLHSLWDTKLLEHAGLNPAQLAATFDHASQPEIRKWQGDPEILWAWESYQISSQLYGEVEKNGTNIDNAYYEAHMPVIENRIEKAGIRLAGVLNRILDHASVQAPPVTVAASAVGPAKNINASDAASYYGEQVTITAKVFGTRDFGSMVLVNLGAAYPERLLTVVLRGDAKSLGNSLQDKTITVTGKVENYKDKPEIVVTDPKQIRVN